MSRVTEADPCPKRTTGDGTHMFVNYGTKSRPIAGCFCCGCTPTDPTPEAVLQRQVTA